MSIAVSPPPTTTTGKPHLHVGDGIRLRRAGELQRHQEVGRRAHAGREAVRQFEHRRPARARRDGDVIEAERERAVGVERSAEAHAAEEREAAAALEQEPDDLEEILVPAHGDAVLGDAAESRHHAIVERFVQHRGIEDRLERHALAVGRDSRQRGRQRLDLEAVDADDRVAVVQQVVRQREAGGPHADDERPLAGRGARAAAGAG